MTRSRTTPVTHGGVDLTGRVVLVTGGTRGIGAEITRTFLGRGARCSCAAAASPSSCPRPTDARPRSSQADVRDAGAGQGRSSTPRWTGSAGSTSWSTTPVARRCADAADGLRRASSRRSSRSTCSPRSTSPSRANEVMQRQPAAGRSSTSAASPGRPGPGHRRVRGGQGRPDDADPCLGNRVRAQRTGQPGDGGSRAAPNWRTSLRRRGGPGPRGRDHPHGRMATPADVAAACLLPGLAAGRLRHRHGDPRRRWR